VLGGLVASAVLVAAVFAGCSLGLDESKIGAGRDASAAPEEAAPREDGGPDAEASSVVLPDGGACTRDDECKSTNACLTARCDRARGACVYDVCKQPNACASAVCDLQSLQCGTPATYPFHAAQIKVTVGGVGCGSASRCFAAVYPFLFVGTTNGVVAYPAENPANASPTPIPVTGLPFLPSNIVASGNRVYFVGTPLVTTPSLKLPLAWIDVPADPLAKQISATTVLHTVAQPNVGLAFPQPNDGLLLVVNDAARVYPALSLAAPLQDLQTLTMFPLAGLPANAVPVASSGTRLMTYRLAGFVPQLSFETGAGTQAAQNAGEQAVGDMGPVANQFFFSSAPDGSVLYNALSVTPNDAGGAAVRAVRLTWLVSGPTAGFDSSTFVDVETYGAPPSGNAVGPVAWIDPQNVLVTAQLRSDPAQTVVRIATKASPPTISTKQFQIAKNVDSLGAAATNGIGYVLVADSPNDATIHVFAPGCD
jgi:hypothetical protein